MKIIVSGGGTGGHIYPAIAIIEEFLKRDPDTEVLYVGTKKGLESDIVPKLGIPFKTIHVKGLPRKLNRKSVIAARELFKGLRESKKIISDFNPDVVIGTGGYVSGPVLFSATRNNIFTVFHEQNSYPGITNRILSGRVDSYFVTFGESLEYFKNTSKAIITGNPIRNRFGNLNPNKEVDYDYFGLDKDKKTVFCFGGSNGSQSINDTVLDMIENMRENKEIQLIHATGKDHFDSFMDKAGDIPDNVKIYSYMTEIDKAYNISDLIITSSGAITLAEISFLGLASILIPKGYTTENHQEFNARTYEKNGAAKVILEKDLKGERLYEEICDILSSPEKLEQMGIAAKKFAKPEAAKDIVDEIIKRIR